MEDLSSKKSLDVSEDVVISDLLPARSVALRWR